MTGIKINGEFLVIDNLRVTFEIENSAFSEDIIFSGFSIPGEAPVCEINNRILSFGYKLNLAHKVKQFPCEFHFKGMSIFYGTFNLLETSRKSYRWNMSISGLSALLLDKKLKELNYGEPYVLGDTTIDVLEKINDMASQSWPDIPVCFPVTENIGFYGELNADSSSNPDYKGYLNRWFPLDGEYKGNWIIQAPAQDNHTAFVPWIFTHFILQTIFENAGWVVTGTFLKSPELQKHIIYSGRALDKTIELGFFKGRAPGLLPQTLTPKDTWQVLSIQELEDPDGRFAANEYEVPMPHPGSGVNEIGYFEFNLRFKSTFVTPGPVMVPTELTFGVWFDGDPLTDVVIIEHLDFDGYDGSEEILVLKARWLPVTRAGEKFKVVVKYHQEDPNDVAGTIILYEIQIKAVSLSTLNLLANEIDFTKVVPDLTVRDFLKEIRDEFNLSFTPNLATKEMVVDFYDPKLRGLPNNLTRKVLYEYNSTLSNGRQYIFGFNWNGEDQFEDENFKLPDEYVYLGEFDNMDAMPAAVASNQVVYITNLNRYYITYKDPQNFLIKWKFFADKFQPLNSGEGEVVEIKPTLRPVFMNAVDEAIFSSQRLTFIKPALNTKGNSPCFGLGTENKQPLKSAFWRGLQPDRNGLDYPMATPYRHLDDGTAEFDSSLRWDEPIHGLWDMYWKSRATAFQETEFTEMDAELDLGELLAFDVTQIQLVEDVYYAIKMMRLTFADSQILPTELEMYRL